MAFQRKLAKLIPETPKTTKPPTTTTSTTTTQAPPKPPTKKVTTRPPSGALTVKDFEQEQNDVASIQNDLALLGSLLGRRVTLAEIPELTKSFGINGPPPKALVNMVTTTTTAKPSHNEVIDNVHPGSQKTRVKSEIDSGVPKIKPETFDGYGKTDDALLATLLKQNGIGPANNNIPVQLLLHQVMGAASTPFSRNNQPTESYPQAIEAPVRPRRPIVDGLTWLWKTWQETAPKKRRPVATNAELNFGGPDFSAEEYTEANNGVRNKHLF